MSSNSKNAAELREQETALRSRLDVLATEFADGVLTPSQLRTATERIKLRLAKVESRLYGPDAHRYFGDVIDADDPRVAFHELPMDRKRALIESMVTVTIMPAGHGDRRAGRLDAGNDGVQGTRPRTAARLSAAGPGRPHDL